VAGSNQHLAYRNITLCAFFLFCYCEWEGVCWSTWKFFDQLKDKGIYFEKFDTGISNFFSQSLDETLAVTISDGLEDSFLSLDRIVMHARSVRISITGWMHIVINAASLTVAVWASGVRVLHPMKLAARLLQYQHCAGPQPKGYEACLGMRTYSFGMWL
jgi:hypothetical protein